MIYFQEDERDWLLVAWLATKMAEETVCFSGSSAEEIELAKRFWQAIYPPVKPKSALIVTGIDHRLCMAPRPQNGENTEFGYQLSCLSVTLIMITQYWEYYFQMLTTDIKVLKNGKHLRWIQVFVNYNDSYKRRHKNISRE